MTRQIFLAASFLFFIYSCGERSGIKEPANESQKVPVTLPVRAPAIKAEINLPVEDPSFITPKEISSVSCPSGITRNILQDKKGIIWLATWEGIISFDGKVFTNVTFKESLKHFHVFSILEDRTGNIWFGTIGGGVYRYDGNSFSYFTTADGLAGNVILCMQEDNANGIWFGTKDGVSRYDGKKFTNFTTKDGLNSNFVHCIALDKAGKLWFGNQGGINLYNHSASGVEKSFSNFTNEAGASFYIVQSIVEDKTGIIWIASADGLSRYDARLNNADGHAKSIVTVTKDAPYNMLVDRSGDLWLSNGQPNSQEMNLTKYDGKTFTRIKSDKQIFGVTEDRDGNIWFGTMNGVSRYDGKTFSDFHENTQ